MARHGCCCGARDHRSEPEDHAETCDLLAYRLNRVAALRSELFGGAFQNPELAFFALPTRTA